MTRAEEQPAPTIGLTKPEGFAGEFITPEDPRYDAARTIENRRVMRRPAAIAQCTGVSDVQAVLRFARAQNIPVTVRSGGHGAAGWSSIDGGIVIDMRLLHGVTIDAAEKSAWVGGGTLAIDLITAAHEHGLAAVTGISSSVGLGGLLLGLGEGYLTGRHGFGVDNIEALKLVTATGEVLEVSASSHPDLFWALRGAGANFGVVTAMKLRLHAAPAEALGGTVTFGPDDVRGAIDYVWDLMANASLDSWPSAAFYLGDDSLPRVNVTLGHVGSAEEGEAELRRLRSVGAPLADTTRTMSYTDLVLQGGAVGEHTLRPRAVWNVYRFALDGDLEAQKNLVLECQSRLCASPATYISVWRTPEIVSDAPASVAPRSPGISVFIRSMWVDEADDELHLGVIGATSRAFVESGLATAAANTVNHVSELDEERLRELYGAAAYDRLGAIKATYDPENVFAGNANIRPA